MFDRKTQMEALERMVEFNTRAGNTAQTNEFKEQLAVLQAAQATEDAAKEAEAAKVAAQSSVIEETAVEIPIEPPKRKSKK
jgi:anaerobic ribonucleoside-triphosphate reductase